MTSAGWCDVCLISGAHTKATARVSMKRECASCTAMGRDLRVITADGCDPHIAQAMAEIYVCEHGEVLQFSEPIPLL